MAEILYLRCRNCGGRLGDHHSNYCESCNLTLAYRALPFILGLLLLGAPLQLAPAAVRAGLPPPERYLPGGYDDENALAWE